MYEYEVVRVGNVSALEQDFDKQRIEVVEGKDVRLEDAIHGALSFFARDGWKLHTCHIEGDTAVLVFERVTRESARKLMATLGAP